MTRPPQPHGNRVKGPEETPAEGTAGNREPVAGAVERREEWYSQVVEGMPIATFVIDARHRVITCNKAFERLTGIPTREIVGTDNQWRTFYDKPRPVLADLIVDGVPEAVLDRYYSDKYRRSTTVDGAYEVEDFFPALGDNGKWIYFTAAPLKDASGRVIGALETLQDITGRKRAMERIAESERRLRHLLDFAPYPIVVFTPKGMVYYLNPAFTQVFGWRLEALEGTVIPFEPPGLEGHTHRIIGSLHRADSPLRRETRRVTRDGQVLDVVVRATRYFDAHSKYAGVLMFLRDVTRERREARNTAAIHRISLSLPVYTQMDELLDYISGEVRRLMVSEGALIMLLDEERDEIYIVSAAYEDPAIEKRIKEIRFPSDVLVAGEVIKTGEPIIVNHPSDFEKNYEARDEMLGYRTRSLALAPMSGRKGIIGVLGAVNEKTGVYDAQDTDLLNTIGSTVALSIENARFARELQGAYDLVRGLNRAKDKVIHHLSHELKTPVAVLSGSLTILSGRLKPLPEATWKPTIDRARRNLDRLVAIQDEVQDIMSDRRYQVKSLLTALLDQCTDELETLLAEEVGEGEIVGRMRRRIEDIFGVQDPVPVRVRLDRFVPERMEALTPMFAHREVRVRTNVEPVPAVRIPGEVLAKVMDGLVKNAVENTPDGGSVEAWVRPKGPGVQLGVRDYGVGIPEEAQKRIFEGFFPTRDTMAYSSKRPFDFNAGGKGADLLRTKIFSERYRFRIEMNATRCPVIPSEKDQCPGRVDHCTHCAGVEDCERSGGATFILYFPPATDPARPDEEVTDGQRSPSASP